MSLFVTLEGPEGAGKSTQAAGVARRLTDLGFDVLVTREPGGTQIGESIREILLSPHESVMVPETEALLMTAARAQHVAEVIRPALRSGKIVLCDRYIDSTLAYQGAGRGLDINDLRALQVLPTGGLLPDLTVLLDVPVEVGLHRKRAALEALNRFDEDSETFHNRVRSWFLAEAARDSARWVVVEATNPQDVISDSITAFVCDRLQIR